MPGPPLARTTPTPSRRAAPTSHLIALVGQSIPPPPQRPLQPFQRQGVEHVARLEPAAAGRADAETLQRKLIDSVRIGVDDELGPGLPGAASPAALEVHPSRLGVD